MQKMVRQQVTRSFSEIETDCIEIVKNELLIHPDEPSSKVGDAAFKSVGRELSAELSAHLGSAHFVGLARKIRKEMLRAARKPLLPGFDQIPAFIVGVGGKKIGSGEAPKRHFRAWVASLRAKHRARLKILRLKVKTATLEKTPLLKQAEEILAKLNKAESKSGSIRVKDALGL